MNVLLLTVDAAVDLALGVLLIWYPPECEEAFGLPLGDGAFFASVLGAVLVGVGVALLVECARPASAAAGLGLAGAVAINLCGGIALAWWLLFGLPDLTPFGRTTLWLLVALLVGLSALELRARSRRGVAQP